MEIVIPIITCTLLIGFIICVLLPEDFWAELERSELL